MLLLGTSTSAIAPMSASIVQGALHEAARMATVGGVPTDADRGPRPQPAAANSRATRRSTTTTRSYSDFTGVRMPETITKDTAPVGIYNPGDCFQDVNGNGSYDLDRGRGGIGGAEDVVYFEVTMTYPQHRAGRQLPRLERRQ